MTKIYTKVGDKGETVLIGGQKVLKDDLRIEAYGTIDELNSMLGLARVEIDRVVRSSSQQGAEQLVLQLSQLNSDLEYVQHWLFDLGSLLAASPGDRDKFHLPKLSDAQIQWMEHRIDVATTEMPPLKDFILPGGTEVGARLHCARTIVRRAERCMVKLGTTLPEHGIIFINRLSDYLFTMARWSNFKLGVKDTIWKKTTLSS